MISNFSFCQLKTTSPNKTTMLLPSPPTKPLTDRAIISLPVPAVKKKLQILLPPASQTPDSPKKRVRVVSHGFSRKRQRPAAQVSAETPQAQESSRTGIRADSLAEGRALETNDSPNSAGHDPALFNKEFQFYSRAVFGKCVGLYQICETLWVVQGWTHRSGGNLVCAKDNNLVRELTCFLKSIGTTWSAR